jgi:hypothetical protein
VRSLKSFYLPSFIYNIVPFPSSGNLWKLLFVLRNYVDLFASDTFIIIKRACVQ